jgi:large subunit ribosomal protein L3
MPAHKPRDGSLQYWPRKRVKKVLSRVNWDILKGKTENKVLGFLCYKVSMKSAIVKDNTPDSLTKGKNIVVPITILEAPSMKILSIRFYKNSNVIKEILNENLDKELKRKIKIPKEKKKVEIDKEIEDAKSKKVEDIRILVYSNVKKTGIKKTPDILEIGLDGSLDEKINFIKNNFNKEILITDIFKINHLIDARGLTKAFGTSGPVKRFGISLRSHKAEKGVRRPGSLGAWKPSHTSFRAPMSGQHGYFHRTTSNLKILDIGKTEQKDINLKTGFEHFGNIKTDYIIIKGNVAGPEKSCLILTSPLRETKKTKKQNYQLVKII